MPIIANTMNALLGVGIFVAPWGYLQSGLIGGTMIIFLIGFLSFETARTLLVTQRMIFMETGEIYNYPEITSELLGKSWSNVVKTATVISCLGGCCGYLIFLGETIGQLLSISLMDAVVLITLPLILLSWVRSFRKLTVFTITGVVAIVLAIFCILFDGMKSIDGLNIIIDTKVANFLPMHSTVKFIGPATFLFTIHYCVLSMGAESLKDSIGIGAGLPAHSTSVSSRALGGNALTLPLVIAYIAASGLVSVLGAVGFLLYRNAAIVINHHGEPEPSCVEHVCQNIILNLPSGQLRNLVGVALSLSITFSYIIIFAPAREHIESAVLRIVSPSTDFSKTWTMNLVRSVLVVMTAVVAIYTPYFGSMIGAVGGFTDALQSFVLPPLIYLSAQRSVLSIPQIVFYNTVFLWGMGTMAFTVYSISSAVISRI